MAAVSLDPPGTEFGPCAEPCQHIDCDATRREAATVCNRCGQPIGYGRGFFNDNPGLAHASCVMAAQKWGSR